MSCSRRWLVRSQGELPFLALLHAIRKLFPCVLTTYIQLSKDEFTTSEPRKIRVVSIMVSVISS